MFVMSVIAACVLTALVAPAVEAQAADLFTPVTEAPSALPSDDLTLRSRVVTLDLEQVERARATVKDADRPVLSLGPARSATGADTAFTPGTVLTFNLFDDVVVTGRVEHTAPTFSGGYSISGSLVGEPLGSLALVVNGETVAGTVRRLGETYQIRSMGEGLYAISEVEEPQLGCGVDALHAETDHHRH